MRGFLPDIALLRVVSILLVLLGVPAVIVIEELGSGPAHWTFGNLYDYIDGFIIPLFIFISGFMIGLSRGEREPEVSEGRYLIGKIKRFLPSYLFFGLMTALVLLAVGEYTLNGFLIDYIRDFLVSEHPAHLWFLLALMLAIIAHGLLRAVIKDDRAVLAVSMLLFLLVPLIDLRAFQIKNALTFLPYLHFGYMARGLLSARWKRKNMIISFLLMLSLSLLLSFWSLKVGFPFLERGLLNDEAWHLLRMGIALAGISYMVLLARIVTDTVPHWFDRDRMKRSTRYLFGIYLVHFPVLIVLMRIAKNVEFDLTIKGIAVFFIGVLVSIALVEMGTRFLRMVMRPGGTRTDPTE